MKHSIFVELLLCGLLVSPQVASAAEIPQVKPGLWEVRLQSAADGKVMSQAGTTQICWDAATLESSRQKVAAANKNCSKSDTRKEGGKWITDGVCKVGNSTVTGRQTREFGGENAYHDEGTAVYDPPISGRSRVHMITDGKWLGPC